MRRKVKYRAFYFRRRRNIQKYIYIYIYIYIYKILQPRFARPRIFATTKVVQWRSCLPANVPEDNAIARVLGTFFCNYSNRQECTELCVCMCVIWAGYDFVFHVVIVWKWFSSQGDPRRSSWRSNIPNRAPAAAGAIFFQVVFANKKGVEEWSGNESGANREPKGRPNGRQKRPQNDFKFYIDPPRRLASGRVEHELINRPDLATNGKRRIGTLKGTAYYRLLPITTAQKRFGLKK